MTWHQAKRRCGELGGHLPMISNEAENRFIFDLVAKRLDMPAKLDGVWLGATDEAKEGDWRWIDGNRFAYINWCQQPKQPNNAGGDEHYLWMWLAQGGVWTNQSDAPKQATAFYVCEWDTALTEPAAKSAPELTEVRELNPGSYPWLTDDGLTVVWERTGTIWTAARTDANSTFADKRELFRGRHPTLTAEGLEIVFLSTASSGGQRELLQVAKRRNAQQPFGRASVIQELADQPEPKNPSLSPDGLTLCFNRNGSEMVVCTRKATGLSWSKAKPLPVHSSDISGFIDWPYLDESGLALYCANEGAGRLIAGEGNLMIWSRSAAKDPFAAPRTIEVEGLPPLLGRSPRYVAATRELFFTRAVPENGKPNWIGIWAVKNFTPPRSDP